MGSRSLGHSNNQKNCLCKKGLGNWNISFSDCDQNENNSTDQVILDPTIDALQSSSDYYKFIITVHITRNWDMPSNSFFMQAYDPDCIHNNSIPLRPMNVDNGRLSMGDKKLLPWNGPCLVPEPLRSQILKIDNFTDPVWESLARSEDLQLLGNSDMVEICKLLSVSQPVFTQLYNQLQNCPSNGATLEPHE